MKQQNNQNNEIIDDIKQQSKLAFIAEWLLGSGTIENLKGKGRKDKSFIDRSKNRLKGVGKSLLIVSPLLLGVIIVAATGPVGWFAIGAPLLIGAMGTGYLRKQNIVRSNMGQRYSDAITNCEKIFKDEKKNLKAKENTIHQAIEYHTTKADKGMLKNKLLLGVAFLVGLTLGLGIFAAVFAVGVYFAKKKYHTERSDKLKIQETDIKDRINLADNLSQSSANNMTANNITATCILNPKFAREFGLPKGSTKKFKNINPSEVSKLTNDTIDYLNSRNPVPVKKPEPVKLHPDQKILNTKLNLERERLKESMTKVIKKRLTVSQERRI